MFWRPSTRSRIPARTSTRTDAEGRYRFDEVRLGEYVLTVEAPGFAPRQRHVKVAPQSKPQDFALQPGRLVCGRVVDAEGHPIAGLCVVMNQWHCHSDERGYFHWSAEAPVPQHVKLRVSRRYRGTYEKLETPLDLAEVDGAVFTLKKK